MAGPNTLSATLAFELEGGLAPQVGDFTSPLPSRSGFQRGGIGRPVATAANTFGLLSGTSPHAALGARAVDLSQYIEATAAGQAARFTLSSLTDRIPDEARILFVQVRVRARSVGSGAGTLRIAPLTALGANTLVTEDVSIAVAPAEYTALFHAQEAVSGEYAAWDRDALAALQLRIESIHATNHVRVFHVEVIAFHLPVTTMADFLAEDLAGLGWVAEGNVGAGSSRGVARLLDTSSGFLRFSKATLAVMPELGDAAVQIAVPSAWAEYDGVYAFTALTVERVDRHIALHAINDGGTRKLGLLAGPPGSNDPTLLGSYVATAEFDWQERTCTLLVAWDGVSVSVYADDGAEPLLSVAESALAAGSTSNPWGGPCIAFGTGWQPDGTVSPSKGEVLYLSAAFRGRQEPEDDSVTLDYQERREMSTADGFESTRLLWHAGVAFDRFKIRYGGAAHDDGFFISTANGSVNTEGSGLVGADEVVESLVAIRDLLPNDRDPDGPRVLRVYVRNASTGAWSTLLTGALGVPLKIFRTPPVVAAGDFVEGSSSTIALSADREFRVEPEVVAIPAGKEQAADLVFGELEGIATTLEPAFDPHQDGFPGIATEVPLVPPDAIPLNRDGAATLGFRVYDAYGLSELRLITFQVREATPFEGTDCDAGYRRAVPPITLEKGGDLEAWLRIWDRIACRWQHIAESMEDLIDIRRAPPEALPFKFQEAGLTYPNVPGYPVPALRRLLARAREINGRRYSLPGLRFYLQTLIPGVTEVDVEGFLGGAFMFCDSGDLGLPTLDQINSAGTANDTCTYLAGPLQEQTIVITITGTVSAPMQEFVRATIRDELIMADDPVSPKAIQVVFVEA